MSDLATDSAAEPATGQLAGKVAIVTGGASGFGEGIVRRFQSEGARVVICDIQDDLGRAIAKDLGETALFSHCDVRNSIDISNAVKTALGEFGKLDIVVNNAGVTHRNQPALEVEESEFDRVFDINVKAIYRMTLATVPVFREQGGGVVLNVASTAGVRPRPGLVWYNSSKAAVIGMTKSMAIEFAPDKIRVNAINPVAGDTPLLAEFMGEDTPERREQFKSTIPWGRFSTAEDMAATALFLCSDQAEMITGSALEVDGGRCI